MSYDGRPRRGGRRLSREAPGPIHRSVMQVKGSQVREQGDVAALRREIRTWLKDNLPADWRLRQRGDDIPGFLAMQREWFAKLVEGGYAAPHWPDQWSGGGRSLAEQIAIF